MGERVRLGDLLTKARSKRCGDSSYPVLSMTMHDGIVRQDDRFKKSIASRDTKSYKVVIPGQLVVGFPIDEGVIYIQKLQQPGIMSPAYQVWDVDESRVRPRYLELALHSPKSMAYYAAKMRGTTARRRSITADNLCALEIPVPSLERQDCIVATFERVGSLLASCEQASECLDSLVKSQFVEMFGKDRYPIVTIGDVSSEIRYGTSKKASEDGRYIYLRMNNLTDDGRLDLSDIKRIDLTESELEKCVVEKGDLLFNRTNSREKVGKTAVFDLDEPMVIAGYIIRVRLQPEVDSIYLSTFMNLEKTKALLQAIAKGAVHQANINARQLAAIEFPLPPLPLQQEFAAFVAEVDKSRFVARKSAELIMNMQALDIRPNARLQ